MGRIRFCNRTFNVKKKVWGLGCGDWLIRYLGIPHCFLWPNPHTNPHTFFLHFFKKFSRQNFFPENGRFFHSFWKFFRTLRREKGQRKWRYILEWEANWNRHVPRLPLPLPSPSRTRRSKNGQNSIHFWNLPEK